MKKSLASKLLRDTKKECERRGIPFNKSYYRGVKKRYLEDLQFRKKYSNIGE